MIKDDRPVCRKLDDQGWSTCVQLALYKYDRKDKHHTAMINPKIDTCVHLGKMRNTYEHRTLMIKDEKYLDEHRTLMIKDEKYL